MGRLHACVSGREGDLSGLQDGVELRVGEGAHRLRADVAARGKFGEEMEDSPFPLGGENEDAVVAPDGPAIARISLFNLSALTLHSCSSVGHLSLAVVPAECPGSERVR